MPSPSKSHWDRIYSTTRADQVSWYQPHAERSLELIRRGAQGRSVRVIDVGGGASTLVDDLLEAGVGPVSVLDISTAALDAARARLGPRAAGVAWLAGDVTRVALPAAGFDIWHDRAVFHFLTDAGDRAAYVAQVRHALAPGGRLVVATFAPDGPERCSGLPVVRYAPQDLCAVFGAGFALRAQLREDHRTPGGVVQPFVYGLLVRR